MNVLCPPLESNQDLALFKGTRFLLRQEGRMSTVDLAGIEPATSCLPDTRATVCATSPSHMYKSEARESNAVCPAPKAGGLTVSLAPDRCPVGGAYATDRARLVLPSTVDLSKHDAAGRDRSKQGRQEL